jgi:hypothetical protein
MIMQSILSVVPAIGVLNPSPSLRTRAPPIEYFALTGHISQRLVYRLLLNDARQDEKSADGGTDHQNESNLTHE